MARGKQTAKKLKRKGGTSKEEQGPGESAGSSQVHEQAKRKRVNQHQNVLRQIREAQEKTCHCIPRASFVRQVREISERHMPGSRWYYTALACIQEAAEDYCIEYFNDTCIIAANARRVTIMNRDMSSLSMVRQRYTNFIHHPTTVDKTMRDILLVLPTAPKSSFKIEEVTEQDIHAKKTRLNEERIEALQTQQDNKKDQAESKKKLDLLARENEVLKQLQMKTEDYRVCYGDGEDCDLLQMDIQMLRSVDVDISDRVILACLR